jgi:DNA-binding NarL/FixJ family response regulator
LRLLPADWPRLPLLSLDPGDAGSPTGFQPWLHGPSELRVLRYLPTNLSRPQIAGELFVSLNTVNTHVHNIYAKLQVRDRSAAVQRARDLRLLAPAARLERVS